MKKIFCFSLFFLVYILITKQTTFADYSQSLSDYKSSLENYYQVYESFKRAKNSYLKYKTLNSQTEALEKTRAFLESKDQVLILYYQLLIQKLDLTPGIPEYEKSLLKYQLDSFLQEFKLHQESLSAIASLDDFVQKSKEIDDRKTDLEILAHKTIGAILIGKVADSAEKFSQTADQINGFINQIRSEGKKVEKLERWLLETKYKAQLCKEKLTEAKIAFENLNSDYYDQNRKDFLSAKKLVLDGNQYLKEALYNAKEALNEIKTGNY